MDERIDQKTKDTLLNALESAKAYSQKMRDKQERRLWKKFNRIPCDLSDAINRLTKDEMDNIRKKLSFNNLSSLRKAELAAELVRLIPMKFKEVLSYLDQGRYGLIKLIAQNSGVITGYDMKTRAAEALLGYSLVFPSSKEKSRLSRTVFVIYFFVSPLTFNSSIQASPPYILSRLLKLFQNHSLIPAYLEQSFLISHKPSPV
jgi:hypothetical protein